MEIPRMDKEELRSRLDDPGTVLIDVRREQKTADEKIQGASLEDPDQVGSWAASYPQDKTLVLYCS